MEILIRCHILQYLIWICTVCCGLLVQILGVNKVIFCLFCLFFFCKILKRPQLWHDIKDRGKQESKVLISLIICTAWPWPLLFVDISLVFNDPVSSEDLQQTAFTQLIWAFTVHIPLRPLFSSCHSFGYHIYPKYWDSLLLLTILVLKICHSLGRFSRWQIDSFFFLFFFFFSPRK